MQTLRYNVAGQTLSHTPLVRAASATYVVEDLWYTHDSAQRELASGSATVAALAITTDGAVGPSTANARRVPVGSTALLAIGGTYSIVAPSGEWELFTAAGLVANDYVTAKLPLIGSYPSGSTILAHTLTTTALDISVVNDEGRLQRDEPLRIVWTLADGRIVQEQVRIVRQTHGEHDLTRVVQDIPRVMPGLEPQVEHHSRTILPDQAALALEQLRARLLAKGIRDESILLGEQGHWALVWSCVANLAANGIRPAEADVREWQRYCEGRFAEAWDHLTIGTTGKGTVELDPTTDTATATEGYTYRSIFQAG